MNKLRTLTTWTLFFTLMTTSILGQENDFQENEEYCSAYMQSSRTAHWSAYVPITVLVAAAIWYGIADQKNRHFNSSKIESEDGLGCLSRSPLNYHHGYTRSQGGYSH